MGGSVFIRRAVLTCLKAAEILHAVLQEKSDPPYPAQLVQPRVPGIKIFLVDKAAAEMLTPVESLKIAPKGKHVGSTRSRTGRST